MKLPKMKLLRLAVVATVGSILFCGCMANRLDKVVAALGKDPATVHVRVTSIYGVIEFSRTSPTTNSAPHTLSPDGTITVK